MGKSYKGQMLPITFDVRATRPLDDRDVIDTAADRLNPATWRSEDGNYYVYPGMTTRCRDNGAFFTYIGAEGSVTDIANKDMWVAGDISGSGGCVLYIGPEPPEDPEANAVWIDTSGEALPNQEGALSSMRQSISDLQGQVEKLMNVIRFGINAGDSATSANAIISATAPPINPGTGEPDPIVEPTFTIGATVPHVVLKTDTKANFMSHKQNLVDGEVILVTDILDGKPGICAWLDGKLVKFSYGNSSGDDPGSGDNNNDNDDMTQEQIEALYFSKLGIMGADKTKYALGINEEGNLYIAPSDNYDSRPADAAALLGKLMISEVFFGGEGTKIDSCAAATHNFVELANLTSEPINLNGLYLCYYNPKKAQWKTHALRGVIPAGNTFLVRGAQCSVPTNTNLNVAHYDMIWLDGTSPIEFSDHGGSIYLAYSQLKPVAGTDTRCLFNPTTSAWEPVESFAPTTVYVTSAAPEGYIDLMGVQIVENVFAEKSKPVTIGANESILDCVFLRLNGQDVTTNTITAYASRTTSKIWFYCNMTRQSTADRPYFTEELKQRLRPCASSERKTFFSSRTVFSPVSANFLNCTFGRQATAVTNADSGAVLHGADRCFTWVSVGYYDEFLQYRVAGSSSWITIQSITADNVASVYGNDPTIAAFIHIYKRHRWVASSGVAVTTHRVILRGLAPGTYEYRVSRPSDADYGSDTLSFVVKSDAQVADGFSVVHTSDQQGFTGMEYKAWEKACNAMAAQSLPDFMINTGDMTQSGNRESEWLDYYFGRRAAWNVVEMPTVGNNDLGPIESFDFATQAKNKVSAKYFQYLYTFDYDPDNGPYFRYICDSEINEALVGDVVSYAGREFTYYMPSMYSFTYGNYHFICLNSEFYTLADNGDYGVFALYYRDKTIGPSLKTSAYWQEFKWLRRDVELHSGKRQVVFCHEIPFCITAYNTDTKKDAERSQNASSYSELNGDFTSGLTYAGDLPDAVSYAGGFCFSEFFQTHNIKLCFGGHKHTYSLSYPTKEVVNYTEDESGSITARSCPSPNNPIVDKVNYRSETDGVVYAMSQATGYKLTSNNDKPCVSSNWLYKWFPYSVANNAVNTGQLYPMFNRFAFSSVGIAISSYYVDGIYYHPNATSTTDFNINAQYDPSVKPVDGVSDFMVFY